MRRAAIAGSNATSGRPDVVLDEKRAAIAGVLRLVPTSPTEVGLEVGFLKADVKRPTDEAANRPVFLPILRAGYQIRTGDLQLGKDRDYPKVTLTYASFRGLNASTCFRASPVVAAKV